LCLLLAPALALGQGVSIDHTGVGCVIAGRYPRFDARLDPAGSVARARLHFRPEGGPHWYFVDMKSEAGLFRGILPKPQKSLHRFSYYIDVTDKGFNASRTAEFALDVASGPAACGKQKVLAGSLAKAKVLIHAPEGVTGAPALPAGFASEGVVTVTSAGVETAATSGAGGGLGSTALIVGGLAAAGGAAAVIATSKGEGGSSTPGPPVTTPPGPPPTTLPAPTPPPATDLSGTWIGNRPGDGMVLTWSFCSDLCPNTPISSGVDMLLTLSQSGINLSGNLLLTTREAQPAGCAAAPNCTKGGIGEVTPFSVTGTVSGTSVTMQLTDGGPGSPAIMSGTATGNRMTGSLTGTANNGASITGTWSVNLQ
jgi:hypothetical protein